MAASKKADTSLAEAMAAGDLLAEAERRYSIIATMLEPRDLGAGERAPTGTEIKALSIEADRLIHKIVALRAEKAAADKVAETQQSPEGDGDKLGKVVAFDADRFRKSS